VLAQQRLVKEKHDLDEAQSRRDEARRKREAGKDQRAPDAEKARTEQRERERVRKAHKDDVDRKREDYDEGKRLENEQLNKDAQLAVVQLKLLRTQRKSSKTSAQRVYKTLNVEQIN
jgi:hypothetical protein